MIEEILKKFEKQMSKLKSKIDSLPITQNQKKELYSTIQKRELIICPVSITPEKLAQLNAEIKNTYDIYQTAYAQAKSLPATNECDLYAIEDVNKVWDILK